MSPGALDLEHWVMVQRELGLYSEFTAAEGWKFIPMDSPNPSLPLTMIICDETPQRFQRSIFASQDLAIKVPVKDLVFEMYAKIMGAARPLVGWRASQSHDSLRTSLYVKTPHAMLHGWRWGHALPSASARLGASVLLLGAQGISRQLSPVVEFDTLVSLAEKVPTGPALWHAIAALDDAISTSWIRISPLQRRSLRDRLLALWPPIESRRMQMPIGETQPPPDNRWDDPIRFVDLVGSTGLSRWAIASERGLESALRAWCVGIFEDDL